MQAVANRLAYSALLFLRSALLSQRKITYCLASFVSIDPIGPLDRFSFAMYSNLDLKKVIHSIHKDSGCPTPLAKVGGM